MALIHDNVFDAALDYISTNADKVEVRNSASSPLANFASLDASNFGANANYSSGSSTGRNMQCLVSSTSDMKSISVTTGGSAHKVALINTTASPDVDLVVASISSAPVNLGSSDKVNLSTFSVILKDPA